jgi:hypothetical protein
MTSLFELLTPSGIITLNWLALLIGIFAGLFRGIQSSGANYLPARPGFSPDLGQYARQLFWHRHSRRDIVLTAAIWTVTMGVAIGLPQRPQNLTLAVLLIIVISSMLVTVSFSFVFHSFGLLAHYRVKDWLLNLLSSRAAVLLTIFGFIDALACLGFSVITVVQICLAIGDGELKRAVYNLDLFLACSLVGLLCGVTVALAHRFGTSGAPDET